MTWFNRNKAVASKIIYTIDEFYKKGLPYLIFDQKFVGQYDKRILIFQKREVFWTSRNLLLAALLKVCSRGPLVVSWSCHSLWLPICEILTVLFHYNLDFPE